MHNHLGVATLLCLAATTAFSQPEHINVREHIARAGNPADQTAAIRAAFAEAAQAGVRVVYFPAGHYAISEAIDIRQATPVSPGGANITQTNPDEDIFVNEGAWRLVLSGFVFRGGHDHVVLGTGNVDQCVLEVSHCQFFEATGVAVRTLKGSNSTLLMVKDCAFTNCAQVLVNYCDQAHLRDSWISTREKHDNTAVIENFNNLTCQNIVGVPRPSHNDQRWIDNHGHLSCRMFRFGGEGAGFTPVVNYARYAPQEGGPSVILEDCWVSALGNNRRACAIYLEEIPNQLVVRNCMVGGVPTLKLNPKLDLRTYFNGAQPGMLHYDIANNVGEFAGELPAAMLQAAARRKPAPRDYGDRQLSPAATKRALAAAVAAAESMPSAPEPGVMVWGLRTGEEGHRQVTDRTRYIDITPRTHRWDLTERLDATTELCSDYLALAPAGDDVVIMSRMDKGSWPHVRIRNITVDLDQTPFLSWRVKNNGVKGGHLAMKAISNATEAMTTLAENSNPDQYGYFAYDLRRALDVPHGKVSVDLKLYLCGSRCVDALTMDYLGKGDAFVLDYLRLEAP